MRISKLSAQEIAKKLTEKKQEQVKKLETDYQQYITECYLKQTPKEVTECFAKFPKWFEETSYVEFNGNGFNYERVAATERVIKNASYQANLEMTDKIAAKAKQLQNKWQNAQKELNKLRLDIETALCGLKTFTQIEKNLPEAVPYLPKSTSVELMANLDTLRSQINKKGI